MWILTEEYNDYDQHGEYFVKAWLNKPSFEQLMCTLSGDKYGEHSLTVIIANLLAKSGGRITSEYNWYYLHEVGDA